MKYYKLFKKIKATGEYTSLTYNHWEQIEKSLGHCPIEKKGYSLKSSDLNKVHSIKGDLVKPSICIEKLNSICFMEENQILETIHIFLQSSSDGETVVALEVIPEGKFFKLDNISDEVGYYSESLLITNREYDWSFGGVTPKKKWKGIIKGYRKYLIEYIDSRLTNYLLSISK